MMILRSILVLTFLFVETMGYASWLKCYVDLDDSEVVMNHRIVSAERASTTLRLQVRPQGADTWLSSSTEEPLTVSAGTAYEVQFDLSAYQGQEEFENLQFVLEISEGGSFEADRTGRCENARAHGSTDRIVNFTVTGDTDQVQIVGAWALGHSAVSLTPATQLLVSAAAASHEL